MSSNRFYYALPQRNAIFVRTRVIARLQQNPLGPYLEQLATALHRQGYAPSSIQDDLRAGDKFGYWLQRQDHTVTRIDEALLDRDVSGLERHRSGIFARPPQVRRIYSDCCGIKLLNRARSSLPRKERCRKQTSD